MMDYVNEEAIEEEKPVVEEAPIEEVDTYKEFAKDFIKLVSKCDNIYLSVLENDDIDDNTRKGMLVTIEEIKKQLLEGVDKVKKLKNILNKKEEEKQEPVVEEENIVETPIEE